LVASWQVAVDAGASSDYGLTAVTVQTSTTAQQRVLARTGLDVVDHGDTAAEVWLYGAADLATLRATGLQYRVVDYSRQAEAMRRLRASEAAHQAQVDAGDAAGSALPTGRVAYRTLTEIEAEIQALAAAHPDTARLLVLPNKSLLGRTVYGIKISRNVAVDSGEPVFLMSGVHHAREWPTAELTLEFAHDALESDGTDPRITNLLDQSTVIIVPVVNVDGFDMSRSLTHEQKRKNCRVAPGQIPTREQCASAANAQSGVDPNRNYAAFWDGAGSSRDLTAENYHGEAPLSEPEIRNMVELTRTSNVTVAVHNHTPDAKVLRAPSSPEEPVPAEVDGYQALAAQLGKVFGWPAGPWHDIYYDASGVAEQHAFYTQNIFAFTPEMTPGFSGLERFHPPYSAVVEQYTGTGRYATSHAREAWLQAWEAAVNPALHSVLTATAPAGATLTLRKAVSVDSSCPLNPVYAVQRPDGCPVPDAGPQPLVYRTPVQLDMTMTVPADGVVRWHVSPSSRPNQYASTLLAGSYTVTCTPVSGAAATATATVARGQTASVDLSACGR
jgi:hypothetical protein